jgi:hypothetical protein
VDLCRFFCGEVDLDSVLAVTVEGYEKPGALSRLLFEDGIKEENRIPRITNALWKWTSGATGTLVHAVALHGERLSFLLRCRSLVVNLIYCNRRGIRHRVDDPRRRLEAQAGGPLRCSSAVRQATG